MLPIESPSEAEELVRDVSSELRISRPLYLETAILLQYFFGFLAVAFILFTLIIVFPIVVKTDHEVCVSEAQGTSPGKFFSYRPPVCHGSYSQGWNIGGHVILNVLGTIILSGSNYLQQICTSPGFGELAPILTSNKSFTFGTNMPSRLLLRKGWKITIFWTILVLTSIPIHLLLNTIIADVGICVTIRNVPICIVGGTMLVKSVVAFLSSDISKEPFEKIALHGVGSTHGNCYWLSW